MKRVLLTTLDCEIGGFTTHTCNLGRALRRMGYHVSALVFEPFGPCYPDLCRSLDEIHILRRGLETRQQFLLRVITRIEDFTPDILINNAVPFIQAALPFLPQDIIRISVVHSIVDRESRIALAEREYLDWVVAVAGNVADSIRQRAPDWTRLCTIPVGVDTAAEPQGTGIQVGRRVRLIYVGRLAHEKNLPALVGVLDHLHNSGLPFSLTILGDGPEAAWLRNQLSQRPYSNDVIMKGAVPHSEVRAELSGHDILLLTSRFEGTPHVLLEAMAAGLAVASSSLRGSTDRIIHHGVNGFLCDPEAPETYGQVIKELLQYPSRYREVSSNAYAAIKASYSIEAMGAAYSSCLASPAPRPLSALGAPHRPAPQVSAALCPYCIGLLQQARHRLADIYKRATWGRRALVGVSSTASRLPA